MPKREVIQSITLGRGDKRIELTAGQVFDFTDEELAQILAGSPGAITSRTTVDLDSVAGDGAPLVADQPEQPDAPAATGRRKKREEDL